MRGNRNQFARWKHITSRLKGNETLTASVLARELEVSVRTIQRDLDALRDDHAAPILYDKSRRTLTLSEPDWQLRPLHLTESELFHLVIAGGMAGQFQGTPVASALGRLFRKLESALDEPVDLDPTQLTTQMSFHGAPARPVHPQTWRTVVRALRENRCVSLKYRAAGYRQAAEFTVEPVHLSCRRGDWYLLAQRAEKVGSRMYALSRVEKARILQNTFTAPTQSEVQLAKKAFSRFVAGHGLKPVNICVHFEQEAAEWIREREWHAKQTITNHRDGALTLAMPIDGTREALAWILSWGGAARVISPQWLKERVREEAMRILNEEAEE
jgi:predicted DNA-binding transcriptional regulator YafY